MAWRAQQSKELDRGLEGAESAAAELIRQLESGSAPAEARLTQAFHSAEDEARDDILNQLALSAAAGSPYSLELLLAFMTDFRLAAPAISRHVQGPALVEEVEQEVLIAVARSVHRYRGDAKFTTWLYSLARNTAVTELRRLKAASAIDDELGDWTQRRVSSLVAERDMVREAVYSLPPIFRDTVLLRDVERLSYSEIAERQNLAINTVRSRLSRGRALLAAKLPEEQHQ